MADGNIIVIGTESTETTDKKRKISALSSVSEVEVELDTSSNSPAAAQKKKPKKKRNKSGKSGKKETNTGTESENKAKESKMAGEVPSEISRQLADINKKLTNVITRGDGSFREMIREVFLEMKDEFLKSVSHRIDILEGKLFEKETENGSLKKQISDLKADIENRKEEIKEQKSINADLKTQIEKSAEAANAKINDLEQYERRGNLKVNGLSEVEGDETAETTIEIFIGKMNSVVPGLDLRKEEIDIAHRLGPKRTGKKAGGETVFPRRVIVKFISRIKRDIILKNRKLFKGTDIYVNEDLTKINQLVLACVRKKMKDEVKKAWSRNGRIFYENKTGDKIEVKYAEFQDWIDLPWPEAE